MRNHGPTSLNTTSSHTLLLFCRIRTELYLEEQEELERQKERVRVKHREKIIITNITNNSPPPHQDGN